MKKEEKRKIIARKVMTILILAVSLASVSFACTAYAETTLQKETIVYEKVDGVLKQIDIISEDEDPQEFREQYRELAMKEQEEDNCSCLEKMKRARESTIEQLTQQASDCISSLMA